MRAGESYKLKDVAAGTYSFLLKGGTYAWASKSTGSGTIDLEIILPDGATAKAVATQITATTGFQTGMQLPPGQYQIVIATFTANYVTVVRVPGE